MVMMWQGALRKIAVHIMVTLLDAKGAAWKNNAYIHDSGFMAGRDPAGARGGGDTDQRDDQGVSLGGVCFL
ncbi:MAG: hypothetical protein AB1513_04555 [Pseudomonadota bacterium]